MTETASVDYRTQTDEILNRIRSHLDAAGSLQTSGQPKAGNSVSKSEAAQTWKRLLHSLSTLSLTEKQQLAMQMLRGVISATGGHHSEHRDLRKRLAEEACKNPTAIDAAWNRYFPPPLVTALNGIKRNTSIPPLATGQLEISALSSNISTVRLRKHGYETLIEGLAALGPLAIPATEDGLAEEVAVGRASFGARALPSVDGEAIARAELDVWIAALEGLPRWLVKAAFTQANAAVHPPRPVEVKAIADRIWRDRTNIVKRAIIACAEMQERMEELEEAG